MIGVLTKEECHIIFNKLTSVEKRKAIERYKRDIEFLNRVLPVGELPCQELLSR